MTAVSAAAAAAATRSNHHQQGDSLAAAGPSRPVKPVPSCRRCRGNRFPSVLVSSGWEAIAFCDNYLGWVPHAVLRRPPGDFVVVTYA